MKIYRKSAFDKWKFEDKSIQCIITSIPYYSLRKYNIPDIIIGGDESCEHKFEIITHPIQGGHNKVDNMPIEYQSQYCIKCNAWQGQYGLEPSYLDYIEHTQLWAKEAWSILKDDGIFWLNIGDSYNNVSSRVGRQDKSKYGGKSGLYCLRGGNKNYNSKCQFLIPHRIAIALIDNGWILRNTIIWYKTNGMPESCNDRFSKKHEYIFMFVKKQKYYFNLDAVREPYKEVSMQRLQRAVSNKNKKENNPHLLRIKEKEYKERIGSMQSTKFNGGGYLVCNLNPKSKKQGDVFFFPNPPSPYCHYAMFPEKLVERLILCSTMEGDIVLDPFCGSGTTILVAERHNRIGYGIDLGYEDIQKDRLSKLQRKLSLKVI